MLSNYFQLFFNAATRKFKVPFVACIVFLLDNTVLNNVQGTSLKISCKEHYNIHFKGEVNWDREVRHCQSSASIPCDSDSKVSAVYNSGATKDPSLIPGWVRFPGGEHGNPLQYSCLENSMDQGGWQSTVHGVAKSQTQLSDWHPHRVSVVFWL